jgi:hypothetical protein
MYIRRAFTVFLDVQSEACPVAGLSAHDWTLDWRWFCEAADAALPSEPSLIDCSAWARSRTLSPLP